MVTLETERLRLRPFCDDDLDAYAQICADPEVMRYLGSGQPYTRAEAWRHIAFMVGHWHLRGYGMWAVEERARGLLMGRVGLHNPEGWPGLEVGWTLGRTYWGHGYATEAARAALDYAFDVLERPHVISLIRPENAPSLRVAERLGEHLSGTTTLRGLEVLVYRIDRDHWQAVRTAAQGGRRI